MVRGRLAFAAIAPIAIMMAIASRAAADPYPPTTPDPPPPRAQPIAVAPAAYRPSWDLDGTYLWLGPVGAASYVNARWDSTIGGDASVVVIRERDLISLLGGSLGASRWTMRDGGRVWVDGLVGTTIAGRMLGASLGPILELSQLAHPRLGASIGLWGFAGIEPFARIGTVSGLGMFAELGIHIALPVLRR